jgi:hypothetical protein
MFESLSERIHQDEDREESRKERMTRYTIIALVSVAAVIGLVEGVRLIP